MKIPPDLTATSTDITVPFDQVFNPIPHGRTFFCGKRLKELVAEMGDREIWVVGVLTSMSGKTTQNRSTQRCSEGICVTEGDCFKIYPNQCHKSNHSA